MKAMAIEKYNDLKLGRVIEKGEMIEETEGRIEYLESQGVAKRVREKAEKAKKNGEKPTETNKAIE